MLAGTKKIFAKDYEAFMKAMIEAAEEGILPITFKYSGSEDVTLKDIHDLTRDFSSDTELHLSIHAALCEDCGKLNVVFIVDYPDEYYEEDDEDNITYLQ